MESKKGQFYGNQLFSMLSKSSLHQLLATIWAIEAVQSGRKSDAKRLMSFPPEVETQDFTSRYYVHRWKLETLANEAIIHCVIGNFTILSETLQANKFEVFAKIMNALSAMENCEYDEIDSGGNVFDEIHRLTQRQFEWQIGFSSISQIYRSMYLYSGECTRKLFHERYGFSIGELSLFCFCAWSVTQINPAMKATEDLNKFGIADEVRERILRHIGRYANEAKSLAVELRNKKKKMAYRPSVLRNFPCLITESIPRIVIVPLPDLLVFRCTLGLFYDLADAPGVVKHEVGSNFEKYFYLLMYETYGNYYVGDKIVYKYKGEEMETPDVFLYMPNRGAEIAVECKGTKMSFDAKFADDPIRAAERAYKEIAKGVFQIWRYISHKRRGLVKARQPKHETLGLVLTLDPWLTMFSRRKDVFDLASKIAERIDPEISEQDKIHVLFCTIDDIEVVIRKNYLEDLFRAAHLSSLEKYKGWMLSSICKDINPKCDLDRAYPFYEKMGEVLPWWDELRLRSN